MTVLVQWSSLSIKPREMFIQLQKIAYNVLSKILEFVIQK